MPILKKKEIFRRKNSSLTEEQAIQWTQNWLDDFQKNAPKDDNGEYKILYFGDMFDSANGRVFRVFSTACAEKFDIEKDEATNCYSFKILDMVTIQNNITNLNERVTALENSTSTEVEVI